MILIKDDSKAKTVRYDSRREKKLVKDKDIENILT